MATHRIAIAGSKTWPNEDENQVDTIVTDWVMANTFEGDTLNFKRGDFTTGVDTFVDAIAASFTGSRIVIVDTFPTETIYGSWANQVRNRKLLDSGVDVVMVFLDGTPNSDSARNMASMATTDGTNVITTHHA